MSYQKKYVPLLLGVALAVGIFIGGKLNFSASQSLMVVNNSKKDKLNKLIDYIDYEYVDDVNTDSIVDITVNSILKNLDPHSVYIPKEELQRVTEEMKGDFVGIGINFYTYKDTIAVIRPVENGPSQKAGIKSGDRILIADGDTLFGEKLINKDITKKLKGAINSKVNLTVYRKGVSKLLNFTVERGTIAIKSVDAAYMLTNKLGYVKVNRFAETTYTEFKKALYKLKKLGAKEIAVDLRDNPGGFLEVAEQMVDEFLEKDKLIIFTKSKKGYIEKTFATSKGDFENVKLYVLINENSASASEIVAGAIQDNDKGLIIGRRSYGKGLVQREMNLGDGSAVRLTVSRYYTPTGRSIQRPYKNGHADYFDDYLKRLERGELLDPKKIKVADSLKFKTPKGKIVYGGGGIIPDVFIPLDHSLQNESLSFLNQSGLVSYFVFEQLDKDRSAYAGVNRKEFIDFFDVDDNLVLEFQDYVNVQSGANVNFDENNRLVKRYLKAALADQLYGDGAFEEVLNQKDPMIDKLIELSRINLNN